jgi:succinate dehydrogenase/fumarate reductase flavoprotein subunit
MLAAKKTNWEKTTDIIVIGYGMAGAVAAIVAHDLGAKVMIIEKQSADTHCSFSTMSGGVFINPTSASGANEYMKNLSRTSTGQDWTDPDTIKAWSEYSVQNKDWLAGLGASVSFHQKAAEYPQFPGADSIEIRRFPGRGVGMMRFMYDQVNARKIEVRYETHAERLLTDETRRVIGVKTRQSTLRASRAVILCTGGFEDNEDMKLQYLMMYPVYFTGGSINTGEGIKMAQEVGADLWHMNCLSGRLIAKFPEYSIAFPIDFGDRRIWSPEETDAKSKSGYVIVDRYGRRYTSENMKVHGQFYELTAFDTQKLEYPKVPSYHIFDRRRMEVGPLVRRTAGLCGPLQLYKWSLDNSEELKRGWIISAGTIPELAAKIDVPPEILQKTVDQWNGYCQNGADPEFGRSPLDLVPLDSPPFYAIKLCAGGPNTQGGPRRNCKSQVVDPFGEPIPGLYAAGECGSVYGMLYPTAGGNLADCIAFGRIAAENAVRELR